MSTRAIIARPTDDGWQGAYQHSDGYPTWLGKRLHSACREHFDGNAEAMMKFLIDDHPGGWSSIGSLNPAAAKGYTEDAPMFVPESDGPVAYAAYRAHADAPRCYCHSERAEHRAEGSNVATHADAASLWDVQWTYICTPDMLMVFIGCSEMQPVGAIAWDEEVSDERWAKIECGENYERCCHYAYVHVPDLPDEYRQCSMDLLCGARKPEPDDAIKFVIKGVTVTNRGSGHAESYYASRGNTTNGERANGHRWFGSVEYPDGTTKYVPLYSQKTKKFCAGVTPIYPKTLDELAREVAFA